MTLNPQQREVIERVMRHQNVYFTGCAGTGKSFVLKELVRLLPQATTWLTALTGFAALQIGGRTLHSQTGIGLGTKTATMLVDAMHPAKRTAWRKVCVLIIDEASMMSQHLFELIHQVACLVRRDPRPFGGVQVVLCGDMYQLPPVSREEDLDDPTHKYCFESPVWAQAGFHTVELTHVYRQADSVFVSMLDEVRHARMCPATVDALVALERPLPVRDGVLPTRLFATNAEADCVNQKHLADLAPPSIHYEATDTAVSPAYQEILDKKCVVPKLLVLKPGAQVILLKNLTPALVNGSRGTVVGFHPKTYMPEIRFMGSETTVVLEHQVWEYESRRDGVLASRCQIPLALAWAITIHKSQGMSIDYMEADVSKAFAYGHVYVGLSRARSLDGLRLIGFHPSKVRTCPRVEAFARGDPPPYETDDTPPYEAEDTQRE